MRGPDPLGQLFKREVLGQPPFAKIGAPVAGLLAEPGDNSLGHVRTVQQVFAGVHAPICTKGLAIDVRLAYIAVMHLSEYMARTGLKDDEVARGINRSRATVSRIRRGKTKPDWSTVSAIARFTNYAVSANDFVDAPEPERA